MWCREHTMTEYPYILFNKSPEQLRQLGACGGRASARNRRARRALVATPPESEPAPARNLKAIGCPSLSDSDRPLSNRIGFGTHEATVKNLVALATGCVVRGLREIVRIRPDLAASLHS